MNELTQGLRMLPINYYLIFCSILFVIGLVGVLTKKNAIVVIMSVELMLNSINLLLAAFSVLHNNVAGQVLVIFIMVVAAAEVVAGLAIIVLTFRNKNSIDITLLNELKG